jgi:DNA repair exonuclease SbcCD ATPase subunit
MSDQETTKKILIPPYAKVKVYWDDTAENYSRAERNKLRMQIARKYGVSKQNIDVIYRPIKVDTEGNRIEIDGAGIDNIMDVNYQRSLMKELLERDGKTVDFERLIRLDEKVNAELDVDLEALNHRKWRISWLSINNFLCFGENNHVNFSSFNGLNVVTSQPVNQGGKTSFSVDALKFLLFGVTTKTDKNEEIFNQYSDGTKLVVRGMVEYDGKEVIIERLMTRTAKRKGGWTIKNKLSYFELLPDGEEKELEEEHAVATTEEIKRTIGNEKDFDITILATARNLEDLISLTPTNSGKLLTKFIGLEVIELKEAIVRKMHSEFKKKMKSNIYDVITLRNEIDGYEKELENGEKLFINGHKQNVENGKDELEALNKKLIEVREEIKKLNDDKDKLFSEKKVIDVVITQLNPVNIESEITVITAKGKELKEKIKGYDKELAEIGNVQYDEDEYLNLTKAYNSLDAKLAQNRASKETHENLVDQLKNGEICPTCKRALEDVDHSAEIAKEEGIIEQLDREYNLGTEKLATLRGKIDEVLKVKVLVDKRNKIELQKDRDELEIEGLRAQIKEKMGDLKKYKDNEDSIKFNQEKDIEIDYVKTQITVKDTEKETCIRNIQYTEGVISQNNEKIAEKEKLIKTIEKENEVEKLYKVYIDLVGKNGISKLVLRSILPIINSEIYRLLEDVCDFEVELTINSKNEVAFIIAKDEIEKPMKSGSGFEKTVASLALRCVLGKMSHLPMPNFITFDEVLGKVANENIEKLKPMFDKIKDMFDVVFLITHNDLVKDWADNIITVKKTNNISKIHVK